jgi:ketosteroid isomerase-like protein
MSQENVEIVKEAARRFVARDSAGLRVLYTPDAVMVPPQGWPEPGPFEGRESTMAQYARLQEDWEAISVGVQKSAAEGDWVVIEWQWQSRGVTSGVPVQMTISAAYRIEGEKVAEVQWFWAWPEALEAAGLRE